MAEEKKPKVYAPVSAVRKTGSYGEFIALGMSWDKFKAFGDANVKENGFLDLTLSPRKEVGKYGETDSVYLNDFVPTAGAAAAKKPF